MVDNNSTDNSSKIASALVEQFPDQSIFLIRQNIQGIIPARQAGNQYAFEITQSRGISSSKVLIVQADADTVYSENYLQVMRSQANSLGLGRLFEAQTSYPESFLAQAGDYLELCEQIDSECADFFCPLEQDLVIDDKAAAYWLADYFKWGTHLVAIDQNGNEVLAETSRLYISAKLHGASRSRFYLFMQLILSESSSINPQLFSRVQDFPEKKTGKYIFIRLMEDGNFIPRR